jgi:iron complex outermembrane receptor protein
LRIRGSPAAVAAFAIVSAAAFGERPLQLADLADLSLEQLANVTVTSASRREERLMDAPASIFVITAEDIRRSGATVIAEAIRLAPNLQVARGDANQYLISARGGLFGTANKMLVLIDGRTIYTPLFAGVFWDAQALMLEDVERIEVISGPGGTLWGTNAVDGVINITTKRAHATQGALVSMVGGSEQRRVNSRFGGRLADGGAYRVYALYDNRADNPLGNGGSAHDASERWQAGFRMDWEGGERTSTFQGDLYGANVDNLGGARNLAGGNVRGRWVQHFGSASDVMLQAYYDRAERRHLGTFEEALDTAEVELQHAVRHGNGSRFVWGATYRAADDRTVTTPVLGFVPPNRLLRTASAYAQDEREIAPRWRATLGLRAEHNPYTGLEWLPQARLAWSVTPGQFLWSSLARAVRSPSRIDRDLAVPGAPPYVIAPNDAFASELADVAELGWRGRWAGGMTGALTAFHHRFRDLRTLEPAGSSLQVMNGGSGRTSGVEGWAEARPLAGWRLIAGFCPDYAPVRARPGTLRPIDVKARKKRPANR